MTSSEFDKNPIDINMGDLIRSVFLNPCDAIARVEEPAICEQVKAPTEEELAEMEKLAEAAAQLQDEISQTPKDPRPGQLKALKGELLNRLLRHGMKELDIHGRPSIEVVTTSARKINRKVLMDTMGRLDPENGKNNAVKIWNAIPMTPSDKLVIPDPSPPD